MSINGTIDGNIDIHLPIMPDKVTDPAAQRNFLVLYKAMRNLQSGVFNISNTLLHPPQYTTAGAPAYIKGAVYFDTTLNKLCIGGATGWETITSA